ncbi:hypothetical protein N7G274_002589 [Stereocaulon virgatum]|uniref:Uncharacterized protein n=1 Tax=Stereocaulon virgatum TaxID=373712 RepID=A0ABR4AH21_9LECA
MQTFTIAAAIAFLATSVYGAPASSKAEARQFQALITFNGADPNAYFTQSVPTDGSTFSIYNPLSVTSITSAGGATCTFYGIDGSQTVVVGAQTVPVGPPQTQVSGSCRAF